MGISREEGLEKSSVHALNSAQVITTLSSVLKELVENALDAGSPSVEVKCKNHGIEQLQVIDAGCGISAEDFQAIGLHGYTSKLANFDQLQNITSLGFRGEAFSSLCGLASVSLHTCTTTPQGTLLDFNTDGSLSNQSQVARKQGTTVTVSNLFHAIPVRHKELKKNARKEFSKLVQTLQAYALAHPTVRFSLSHQVDKKPAQMVFQTSGKGNTRQIFGTIFNAKAVQSLMNVDVSFDFKAEKSVIKVDEDGGKHISHPFTKAHISGLMSRPEDGSGRLAADRQFFSLNQRPFQPSKLQKAFHEAYKTYNPDQYPALVINIELPSDAYDVNLSPDKRTILFHSESNLIEALKAALDDFLMPSRDFDTTMSSARDYNPSGSRTASASSSPNLSMPNIPTVLSRSNSSTSLRDVTTIDDDELEASIIQDEEEEMSKQPPKKRRRISETPDSDIAEETLFEHELPPSPNAQSINRKDVSPDLIVLPSQKKSAPPIRQETVNTMSASWSHILDKASTKSSCHEEAAESSHADFLQRFRNSTQPTKPIQLDEGADGEEVVDQDEDVHTLPKDNDLLNTELSKSPPFPLQSTPAQGLPNPPSSSPLQPTLSQGLPKPPPLRPTQLSLQVQPVASSCQPKSKTSSNPPRSETNSSACPSDNDTPEIEAATDTFVPPHDTIRVDLVSLKQAYDARAAALRSLKNKAAPAIPLVRDSELEHAAGLEAAEANAQAALSRTVQQPDFEKMSICGQFNLGFIIARRTIERGAEIEDDLFIIDQHASDEKYNFETLQANSKLEYQAELVPRVLDLPAMDEHLAMDCRGILELNGFKISVDEDAPIGHRVKLLTHPVSKNTPLGVSDFEELLHLVRENEGRMVRPSKIRSMLASRACRMSVMVGKPLKESQMRSILLHMGTMKQPWACPHGRPTMRHLAVMEPPSLDPRLSR